MLRHNPYALLPLALVLPSIAADAPGAARRRRRARSISCREVERFAREQLSRAHGGRPASNDAEIDRALARYTGLAADVIGSHHGRVSVRTFAREYEKRGDRVLSRYDGVVSAAGAAAQRAPLRSDPGRRRCRCSTPAFTQYARAELGYRTDLPYRLLNRERERPLGLRHLADAAGLRRRARRAAEGAHAQSRRSAC